MDFVYIPEVFTYGYSRNAQYRDYEQPWNRDYLKCSSSSRKSAEHQRAMQQQYKESCYLCKETKRRNLAVYIRSKSRSDSCHGIHEEEEEIDAIHGEKKNASVKQEKCVTSSCNTDARKS
ncbi:hypothetical protein DMN91_011373 [Ooceraea biroi]|uniref:Uncharacterized protein n=1 Tax=Ooceraea biroi TaxID=2015173 RepID=A0A026WSW4_OOCBI|nr:uncharacterized protein LOC105276583 [Ooceraea biroi]EZA58179.1 hypothetical protein X777_01543 [Ooceraea biroi]RLU15620.1 hypothetical protein DMN91_011373 [Ooceraea biroi]